MISRIARHILPILLCACACTANGQAAVIRNLKDELKNEALSLRDRGHKLERLSWYQCGGDPVSAMEAAKEAIAIAERINDPSLLGRAIVRKVAAKQTEGDRSGDSEELLRAVALLQEHGPERDLGYGYWCLYMDLSEVAGQDSLRAAYNHKARTLFERHKEETGRYWVLLMDLYGENLGPPEVRSVEKELEQLILQTTDTFLKVNHYGYLHDKEWAVDDFVAADRVAKEHLAISLVSELLFEEFIALYELQRGAYSIGDQEKALQYGFQMLDAAQRLRSARFERMAHSEIAARFVDLNDNASAMEHFRRTLSIGGGPRDYWDRCPVLCDLGECCLKSGRTDTALVVLTEALDLFSDQASGMFPSGDASMLAFIHQLLGTAFRMQGDMQRSRMHLEQGLKVAQHPDLRLDHARIRIEHARTVALGYPMELQAAIAELDSVITLATSEGRLEMTRDARLALYEVHDRDGNASAALQNLRLYMVAKDSLIDLERIRNINALNKRFESDRKDAELVDLSATNIRQEQEITTHRGRILLLLAGIAVVVLISALLFALLRSTRRGRTLLAEKNASILEAQAKLVESERAREAAEVRTRIARDVHDQLGSDLTKLVMLSSEVKALVTEDPSALSATANDIERVAGEANRSLGDIVWAIDPHHDSLAGLTERVRAHCERMLKWSRIEHTIDCMHTGPDRTLDPATKRDIYLVLREALNNAIKYSKAQHISVTFDTNATDVRMELKDDGVGFETTTSRNGHGLVNMRDRAERIGAQLLVKSLPEKGTSIIFALEPLPL